MIGFAPLMNKRMMVFLISVMVPAPLFAAVERPTLKWQYGGCYSSWCETGWYSSPAATDLDGDGKAEVIGSAYSLVVLDGQTGDVVWRVPSGHDRSTPAAGNVDGNGVKEILFSSYDGRIHSFWLDKTEHHNWPYSVTSGTEGFHRFSLEPVVADLDGDGTAEIIFTSWVEKKDSGALRLGKLHILDYQGNALHELTLPQPKSSSVYWNGALAAPAIANIDDDQDYEIVVNTVASGFVAYDLPGSAGANILWRTGRNKQFNEQANSETRALTPILPLLLSE